MAAKISLAIGLRTLFTVLGLLMLAVFLYTAFTDGLGVRFLKELVRPWMVATLVCFYINIVAFAVWIAYKESNLISSILWIVLIALLGSIFTSAYIVVQFLKLSSQESSQDPMYYVLLRHPNKNGTAPQRQRSSVVTLRIIFSILGVVMLGTLVYTLVTNGSPFRKGVLTPWLATTLVDIYFHIVIYAVWVAYKESSWISAVFWIILLICFSSMATCLYITWQLFQISCQDPAYLVLVHHGDRQASI
uniref:Transmembrane protein n=1 Tax=Glycine max TaxID=3847 RepID=A0A368UG87_SOYBN